MKYAKLIKKDSSIIVPIEIDSWLAMSNVSDLGFSGYGIFKLRQYNNFDNFFTKAENEARDIDILSCQEGASLKKWYEIFNDHVRIDFERQSDRMPIIYYSDYEKPDQKESKLFMPKTGFYVPKIINDRLEFFFKNTLVPLETVEDKKEAEKIFMEFKIPLNQISMFLEPELEEFGSAYSTCPTRIYDPDKRGPFCIDFNNYNDFYRHPNTTIRFNPILMNKKLDEKDVIYEVVLD